jgi:hypothetical protein
LCETRGCAKRERDCKSNLLHGDLLLG